VEASALQHPAGVAGLHGRSPLLRLQSDERLIALVRRGNNHAFEALVARYQSRLLAFCRHMLASKEDAEDVLQEVFAAAFNAILADERAINVRPWLYRIARNRSLNHLRRTQAVGVDSMDVHLSEHGQTTADKVHRREEFRLLIADVQDLPETQRTALLLREIDALSYDQIAEAMETTVPSVKSLLVRARVSLAEAAEARMLSCEEVRSELGEVAEGLVRTSATARRHVRGCERCSAFRKQLRQTNRALASVLPVAPLFMLKKTLLAHLGTTAAASSGTAAASGGAAAAGAAAGGVMQAGVSTLATKAAAGLAAAAIVTAGAVEVKQVTRKPRAKTAIAAVAPAAPAPAAAQAPDPIPVAAAPAEDEQDQAPARHDQKRTEDKKAKKQAAAEEAATRKREEAREEDAPDDAAKEDEAATGDATEQHETATTTLPTDTTGTTEQTGGAIDTPPAAPVPASPGDTGGAVAPPPPPPAPEPAPSPAPTPTPTPQPAPQPAPSPAPSPAPTPTPTPTPTPPPSTP
jgi:RNA polymerase sigma factor (sigma-70 family)